MTPRLSHRRTILLASATAVAVAVSTSVLAVVSLEFFYETKNKKPISFEKAHSLVKDQVWQQVDFAAKFGIKHSSEETEQIEQRVWDHTQYLLSEYYFPQSSQLQLRQDQIDAPVARDPASPFAPTRDRSGKGIEKAPAR